MQILEAPIGTKFYGVLNRSSELQGIGFSAVKTAHRPSKFAISCDPLFRSVLERDAEYDFSSCFLFKCPEQAAEEVRHTAELRRKELDRQMRQAEHILKTSMDYLK